jgi:hypothetical protein
MENSKIYFDYDISFGLDFPKILSDISESTLLLNGEDEL